MSYVRSDTGDGIGDMLLDLKNFYKLLPRLKNAKTEEEFLVWYEKLLLIDRRSLFLALLHDDIVVPEELKDYVLSHYKKCNHYDALAAKLDR